MSRKYCKVKTADGYPVSVAQVRQLKRNCDWAMDTRKADVGTWGRLATDADAAISGTVTTKILSPVIVDLTHFDTLYFGVVADGTDAATWSVALQMNGGGVNNVTLSFTNPGTAASSTGTCSPGVGSVRTCTPQVVITRLSGTGTLALRYIGLWAHRVDEHEVGPQLLQAAIAADLRIAYVRAKYTLEARQPVIGWFGDYVFPTSATTALRWFALTDKLDDDLTINSDLSADGVVYEIVSSAGKTWTLTHAQNNGSTNPLTLATAGTDIRTPFSLPIAATSYDTSTPWSGGKIDAICNADGNRPYLRCMMLSRTAQYALWSGVKCTEPVQGLQLRTASAAGAIGINDLAETVHKCTWYQGGNVSGGMAQVAGKAYTISTTKVTIFDGLIWVHNDAQSGATWGTNEYQVALRASNASTSVTMTCGLTVDGQTGSAPLTFANGENYLTFSINLTSIDVTKYAVPCRVELSNSASRTTTVYSVQISRRGAAY